MNQAAGRLPAANSPVRIVAFRADSQRTIDISHGKSASGSRLGRIRIATPVRMPEASGARGVPDATASADIHIAAAGTSAITTSDSKTTTGLQATSALAASAVPVPNSRLPRRKVETTSAAPHNGTTRYGPQAENSPANVISSGRPGETVGPIHPSAPSR